MNTAERFDDVWTPEIHHTVPQPAGRQCADWYESAQPSPCDLLYALAHTKGRADELEQAVKQKDETIAGLQARLEQLEKY